MRPMNESPVAVLVPDGVGVRNFILGRFLNELAGSFQPHVFHVIPEGLLPHYTERADARVEWHAMTPYLQNRAALVLQYTLSYGHMDWANTTSLARALHRPVKGPRRSKMFVHSTRLMVKRAAALDFMDT